MDTYEFVVKQGKQWMKSPSRTDRFIKKITVIPEHIPDGIHIYIISYRWHPTLMENDSSFDYDTDDVDLKSKYFKLGAPIHVGFFTKDDVCVKCKIIIEYLKMQEELNEKLVSQID